MTSARPRCPACGSADTARIVYGYPADELLDAARHGEVKLGGCVLSHDDPEWHCSACDHEWPEPDRRR